MLKIIATISFFFLFFTGCNQNTIVIPAQEASTNKVYLTLNDAILSLANQLSKNNKISPADTGTITITSFVDLKNLQQTSQFGRVLGESLYSELFIRGFNVSDIRGQNALTINKNGEFYITRDVSKLESEVSNTYITIGTYSKIDQNVIINARIIDNRTGKIVSSARAMYANDDCSIFSICNNSQRKIRIIKAEPSYINKISSTKKIVF